MGRSAYMPPWGDELTDEQIHDLVAFLREVRKTGTADELSHAHEIHREATRLDWRIGFTPPRHSRARADPAAAGAGRVVERLGLAAGRPARGFQQQQQREHEAHRAPARAPRRNFPITRAKPSRRPTTNSARRASPPSTKPRRASAKWSTRSPPSCRAIRHCSRRSATACLLSWSAASRPRDSRRRGRIEDAQRELQGTFDPNLLAYVISTVTALNQTSASSLVGRAQGRPAGFLDRAGRSPRCWS